MHLAQVNFSLNFISVVSVDYMDHLQNHQQDIHVDHYFIDSDGKVTDKKVRLASEVLQFDWIPFETDKEYVEHADKYPGCRIIGSIPETVMKVRGVIQINFNDHVAIYRRLARTSGLTVNLDYQLNKLSFGQIDHHEEIIKSLQPFEKDIADSINPVAEEAPHREGKFMVKHNLKIMQAKFVSDQENTSPVQTYQYSFIKKFKSLPVDSNDVPSIDFQMQFLPIVAVYHVKQISYGMIMINICAVYGGLFVIMGMFNNVLAGLVKKFI